MSDYIKIGVKGEDPDKWKELRSKFIKCISKFLDIVIEHESGNTIRDEAKNFTSALLNYGKAKLNEPGWQNEKLKAEISMIYTEIDTERANARKINAEAQKIEFENAVKSLKFALIGMKLIMAHEEEKENIIFLKELNDFLPMLENY